MQNEGYLEIPFDVSSASEFVRSFQDAQMGGGSRYFDGGFGTVFEAFAHTAKENGGDILLDNRVEKIMVTDGKVTEVVSEKGAFRAPIVIINAGIQPAVLKLVGEEH